MPIKSPVLVMTFNRPDTTAAVMAEFVESRGLGVKKYRVSYQLKKAIGRARRLLGRMMGR